MKKSALLSALLLFTFTALFAQVTETRTVMITDSYDGITMAGTQTVHFEIGPAGQPVTVIGEEKDLDNLEMNVRSGNLTIGFKKGYKSKSKKGVQIYVKNPTLKNAAVSGTGTINISGTLDNSKNNFSVSGTGSINIEAVDCNEVKFSVSGTGAINCGETYADNISTRVSGTGNISLPEVKARQVSAQSSGTGSISISGECDKADLSSSGTGNINARTLLSVDTKAKTSGTGSVYCTCSGDFDGSASGVGKLYLYGTPKNTKYHGSSNRLKVM